MPGCKDGAVKGMEGGQTPLHLAALTDDVLCAQVTVKDRPQQLFL